MTASQLAQKVTDYIEYNRIDTNAFSMDEIVKAYFASQMESIKEAGAQVYGQLRTNVEQLAKEQGKTALEIITQLQAAASQTGNTQLLEDLCKLKWNYVEQAYTSLYGQEHTQQ